MMKNESKPKYAQVELPNGTTAPLLMPDIQKDIKMCIIAENVLRLLLDTLPEANVIEIRSNLISQLIASKDLKSIVNTCKEFITIQMSINFIEEYITEVDNANKPDVARPIYEDVFHNH